ncbi:MAG: hypothetical protein F7C38_01890 [Desulfurococcales archaeon]|nr:hypothetical protein [Desulfurococcales archaeon]
MHKGRTLAPSSNPSLRQPNTGPVNRHRTSSIVLLYIIVLIIFNGAGVHALQCTDNNIIYEVDENITRGTLLSINCSAGYITLKIQFTGECPRKATVSIPGSLNTTLIPIHEATGNKSCTEEFTTRKLSFIKLEPGENMTILFPGHGTITVKTAKAAEDATRASKPVVHTENGTNTSGRRVYTPEELDESSSQGLINKMPSWSTPLVETIAIVVSASLTIASAVKEYGWNRKGDKSPSRGDPGTSIRQRR